MIRELRIIRKSAKRISEAANKVTHSLSVGQVEQEPAFTDRMLGRIEEAMTNYSIKGVRWEAKTLTDRGPYAQEARFGADFIGVLDIHLPGYSVKKGFLAQAKLIEPDDPMSTANYSRMRDQCKRMLKLSAASFLFLYCRQGIFVVPALSVVSADRCNPHELYKRSIARFYEEHFECFVGDHRISVPHIGTLEGIQREMTAKRLLFLKARYD